MPEKRIALALSEERPLSTYPSFVNSIFLLQGQGYMVDIYLHDQTQVDVPLSSVDIIRFDPAFWAAWGVFWKGFSRRKYDYVFFFRERELVAGGLACLLLCTPYVYFSLEMRSYDQYQRRDIAGRLMKALEIWINSKSVLTVVQDDARKALAMKIQGLDGNKVSIVPNSYRGTHETKSNVLRERLGIAPDKVIVLYPGALEGWALDTDLLTEVALWDEKFVLVFHGFSRDGFMDVLQKQAEAINAKSPGRVLFSTGVLAEKEYLDFVSSADIGLVWYKKGMPDAVRVMGKSSGKFSVFMATGIPVIVPSYLESLAVIVEQYRCGIPVDGEEEIGSAMEKLWKEAPQYRERALDCFHQELDFKKFFQSFLSELISR